MKPHVIALGLGILLATQTSLAVDRPGGRAFVTRSPAVGAHGMAATSQPLASLAAIDILRAGGNAVDAAIAANAVQCVTEPTSCGLGGDLFAIVWDSKTQKLHGLNASGRSPQALSIEEFQRLGHETIPPHGVLPITVPGCVDGWFTLHKRFGKLPIEQVLAPAINHARDGYAVTEVTARHWAAGVRVFRDQPGWADVFLIDGQPPQHGQQFRNPALASTLEKIAAGGADAFYRGEIARVIDQFMREHGGYLRYEDLASHHSDWVEPVSVAYRGYEVWELPPNGQGIAALQMLQVLKQFDLAKAGFGSPDHLHLFLEAKKLAFEDRARFYADPDFNPAPVEGLISDEYGARRAKLIDPHHAATELAAGDPLLRDGDTIYLTTADKDHNMVSLIQSNYRGFGAGPCPPGLGFCLQDRGELFNLEPGHANSFAPGKRPFHTIIPAFLTKEGRPVMSFGVMGGDMQPQGHVQIIVNLLDFQMGLQEAGDAPRVRHDGSSTPTGLPADKKGGQAYVESGVSAETIGELERRGHRVKHGGDFGGYQAIWYDADRGVYYGATESRKDGIAIGY
ncbi:putative gamma-glutamyltransferase YwrD [Posidoniimonas polymericola]|uniref:Glutathione hydrolase proenzyme n=1 Tax=Posidoniimonas polymericola TaxID=2528002 RepID=A0A5C5XQJ5_9BACT|nr:gamma-glutamyltransferase [Posidoniimonas polymericola]TWT65174.1 putative gamma-glutamyltransferase YwrD [Posidoniimonas polymericola]